MKPGKWAKLGTEVAQVDDKAKKWTWARNEGRTGPEVVQVAIKIRVPSKAIGPAARGSTAG